MSKPFSPQTERIVQLTPGRSTVVPVKPINLIQTARKYVEGARYSYRQAEGQFVVTRLA